MAGTYDAVAQLLATAKRAVALPKFSFPEFKSSGKYEIIFGEYKGITFPCEEIPTKNYFRTQFNQYQSSFELKRDIKLSFRGLVDNTV